MSELIGNPREKGATISFVDQNIADALKSALSRAVNHPKQFPWKSFQDTNVGDAIFKLETRRYTYTLTRHDFEEGDEGKYDIDIKETGELGDKMYQERDTRRARELFLALENSFGSIHHTPNIPLIDAKLELREALRDLELRSQNPEDPDLDLEDY